MTYKVDGRLYLSFGSIVNDALLISDKRTKITLSNGGVQIIGRSMIMAKLDRNRNMYFASFNGTEYEALGRDNDDLSKDLNPDTETSKNVLGETTFKHNGYEPSVSVDPYYADSESVLYEKLVEIALEEKYGEDTKGYFIEVFFDQADAKAGTMTGTGKKRAAYIVPQSTGGDTSGVGIPFTVNPVGPMTDVQVTYQIATREVTVSPAG